MDSTTQTTIEPVTMSDILEMASWNRERSDFELSAFVSRRQSAIAHEKIEE